MSGLARLPKLTDNAGRQITDTVFAANNPDTSSYVAADGSIYNTSSYPAQLGTSWPQYCYRIDNSVTTPPSNLSSLVRMRQMHDAAGTLVMLGQSGNLPVAAFSTDGGKTWSVVSTMPTQAQITTAIGELNIADATTMPTPDILYDPVSAKYILVIPYQYMGGTQSNIPVVSTTMFYSASLSSPSWTACSNHGPNGPYTGNLQQTTTAGNQQSPVVATTGSVHVIYSAGGTLFTCPQGADATNLANWTTPSTGAGVPYAIGDGTFFAASGSSSTYYTSPDGATWTSRTTPSSYNAQAMRYVAASATYVLSASQSGSNGYLYRSTSAAGPWTSIASAYPSSVTPNFGPWGYQGPQISSDTSAIYALFNDNTATEYTSASLDGITWTPGVVGPTNNAYSAMFNGLAFHWNSTTLSYVTKTPYQFTAPNIASPGNSLNAYWKVR